MDFVGRSYYRSHVASLTKRPTSQFWVACFTDRHGRRLKRSTATGDRKTAQKIAEEYETAARRKRTALQVRKVITQLHREITGDEVSQNSLRNFLDGWLETKAPEIANSTLVFYRNAANKFLAFLGDAADAWSQGEDRKSISITWAIASPLLAVAIRAMPVGSKFITRSNRY